MRSRLALIGVLFASAAQADQGGHPAYATGGTYCERNALHSVKSTGGIGHSGKIYTDAELIAIQKSDPELWFAYAMGTGYPLYETADTSTFFDSPTAGFLDFVGTRDSIEAVKAGVTSSRTEISVRFDVFRWLGYGECSVSGIQCTEGESQCDGGGGTCDLYDKDHTTAGSFQDAWVIQVPNATWSAVESEFGSVDTAENTATNAAWLTTLQGLSGSTQPLLYGQVDYSGNEIDWSGYVVVDVTNASYQAWFRRYVLEMLAFTDADAVEIASKMGWWDYYDGARPDPEEICWRNGDNNWSGRAYDVPACSAVVVDPVWATPYTGSQYRDAFNAMLSDLFDDLDAYGRCVGGANKGRVCQVGGDCPSSSCDLFDEIKVHMQERPDSLNRRWWWMTDEVRNNAHLGCELDALPDPAPLYP